MRKTIIQAIVVLVIVLAAALLLTAIAAAKPPSQIDVTSIEPDTLPHETGGTISVYGSGFTATTLVRLVGYNVLATSFINENLLQATVPPGVPAGTYDLQVSASGTFSGTDDVSPAPDPLKIVAATPVPTAKPAATATPLPTPKPTVPPGRPVLTIRTYSVEPSRVAVGTEFVVTIEIYNTGSRAGENTMVTFPGGTFLPVGDSGHLLWQLHINHTAVVTQRMRAPSGLSSGSYNLPVNLSANDFEGNHYEYPATVAVEVIGVGAGRPQLVIEASQTEPAVLGPGDAFELMLHLANRGSRTATQVTVGAASADLAAPAEGSNVVAVDNIGIDKVVTATLPLVMSDDAEAGRLSFEIALAYSDYTGGSYTDHQSVGLEASTALEDRPQLIVESYHITPESLAPGDTFTLTMTVNNVGGGEAQRMTLTLGGEGGSEMGPFAPLQSSNVKFVPRLAAGDTVEVTQRLVVDGGADAGAYSLPVALAYDDNRGTRHSDSQLISLLVRSRPHLQIGFYRPVEVVEVDVPFELPVEVTNIGPTLVNVSTLEVSSTQLEISEGSLYLGPLDGATSGSLEATAVAHEGGTAEVLVTVHYLDDFEQSQVVTKTLTVEVEEPPEIEQEAEEQKEGEETFWDKVLRFLRGLLGLGS
jgi:hypothetical protein